MQTDENEPAPEQFSLAHENEHSYELPANLEFMEESEVEELKGFLSAPMFERLEAEMRRRARNLAECPVTPDKRAAETLAVLGKRAAPDVTAEDMIQTLQTLKDQDGDCADLLRNQAHAMDAYFHRLVVQSAVPEAKNTYDGEIMPGYIDLTHADIAMRAQNQSRKAIDSLSMLKIRNKFPEMKKT